jgi:hypothetical protein
MTSLGESWKCGNLIFQYRRYFGGGAALFKNRLQQLARFWSFWWLSRRWKWILGCKLIQFSLMSDLFLAERLFGMLPARSPFDEPSANVAPEIHDPRQHPDEHEAHGFEPMTSCHSCFPPRSNADRRDGRRPGSNSEMPLRLLWPRGGARAARTRCSRWAGRGL